jgi:hypothetical protein
MVAEILAIGRDAYGSKDIQVGGLHEPDANGGLRRHTIFFA